ncbi:RmlC-like cupin domain-containing protein [Mycena olivaceomarginata]|nr:RmlC-like cupin domain-containing protein [Mycena olivaceomarginata]
MGVKSYHRPSQERDHADHDWLKTFHTFSFASYQDQTTLSVWSLRVINEDRVAAHNGFGTHSHREFEIFFVRRSGSIGAQRFDGEHRDLKTGAISSSHPPGRAFPTPRRRTDPSQSTSLQIWSLPSVSRLQPKYFTRHFTDAEKRDVWARIVAPVDAEGVLKDSREGAGPAPVQSPLTLYATLLTDGKSLKQTIKGSKGYIHVVQTSGYNTKAATGATIKVIGAPGVEVELKEGDGAYLHFDNGGELTVENVRDKTAEVLLFDLE